MTREEAIYWLNDLKRNNHCDETLDMAIAALRGPQPDPDTGLMPCGCGGKAEYIISYDEEAWMNIVNIACRNCKIHITITAIAELRGTDALKDDAKKAWNRALGYPDA